MKFLIINTDYPSFLKSLYSDNPGLENESYEQQLRARTETLFGVADFYSENLRKLGQEAWDIHANNFHLQNAWMRDYKNAAFSVPEKRDSGIETLRNLAKNSPLRYAKTILRPILKFVSHRKQRWFYEFLAAQIRYYRPDVLLNHDVPGISSAFLTKMRPHYGLLLGQHAALPVPPASTFKEYDLIISSSPSILEILNEHQIQNKLFRLGFEPEILRKVPQHGKLYDVTFIGSLYPGIHDSRRSLIEFLCKRFDQLRVWAPDISHLPKTSVILERYSGQAWGRKLYEVLLSSRITINHHFDILQYANNMRLYEATGVGSLLITDWKENLHEIFHPGKEVVAYRNFEECAEKIQYYLDHPSEREIIAKAGQQRTLTQHTYYQRMQELIEIIHSRI